MGEAKQGKGAREERRSALRIPVDIWVEESSERELYFQRGANLSEGGIFLEHTIPRSKGTIINLRFSLPQEEEPIHVRGEIVNVGESASELGMGVRFLDLSEGDRQRIRSFILREKQKKP